MDILSWRLLSIAGPLALRMHVMAPQTIEIADPFADGDLILDLGGGGEGVIGQLRGPQVVAVDLRKAELDEAPSGPIKVVADARSLPFPDNAFEAATAFFFLMYVHVSDRRAVLREAYRVLVPGGPLHIWDAAIPPPGKHASRAIAVPVCVRLPGRTLRTAYGVAWQGREMSLGSVVALGRDVGFRVSASSAVRGTFHLILSKPN